MPAVVILYGLLLAVVVFGLWAAYRVLGTPSRLTPGDYTIVLTDLLQAVERAAGALRAGLEAADRAGLDEVASESRKIFQTGYYQTLRLRPSAGPDLGEAPRAALRRACEAYDWASRMASAEGLANPALTEAVRGLMDAGDRELDRARRSLAAPPPPPESSAP